MWSRIICAVSFADGSLGRGIKWTILLKWSTTVRMTVLSLDGGIPVTKSKEMWDQGQLGTGRGRRRLGA